jgi:F0F1-type ATP synthase assembly protein I
MKVRRSVIGLALALVAFQAMALVFYARAEERVPHPSPSFEQGENLETKPPLEPRRLFGELLAGIVGGAALGYLGHRITYQKSSGWLNLGGVPGAIVGFSIGTSLGVWAIGSAGNQTGSFLAAMLGTVLGSMIPSPSRPGTMCLSVDVANIEW